MNRGLNEELGRHRGREGRKECLLCDAECESVRVLVMCCVIVLLLEVPSCWS